MAIGDVISQISAANTLLEFQPAVGIEVVITSIHRNATAAAFSVYNGTNSGDDVAANNPTLMNVKIMVNNTIYFRIAAAGAAKQTAFTGMQIK